MAGRITDIAKAAGVSIATVSAVINEKGRISEATRKRVLDVVQEMAYDTRQRTALLKGTRTNTVGLVLPMPSWENNDFYSRAIMAATDNARENGRDCKVLMADDVEKRLTESFHKGSGQLGCDQLVLFCPPAGWQKMMVPLKSWNIPTAVIRRQTDVPGVTFIVNDDYKGMRMSVEHLADNEHKVIGLLRPDTEQEEELGRLNAYRDVLKERGLCSDERLIISRNRMDFDLPGMLAGLRKDGLAVTAIACYGDHLAQFAASQLLGAGVRIPQEMAIMGYDNDPISQKFYPPISTVDIPVEKMVRAACHAVFNYRLEMAEMKQVLSFDNELIIRQTS